MGFDALVKSLRFAFSVCLRILSHSFLPTDVKPGQSNENDIYSNSHAEMSEAFTEFLEWVGTKVALQGWSDFSGGLDVRSTCHTHTCVGVHTHAHRYGHTPHPCIPARFCVRSCVAIDSACEQTIPPALTATTRATGASRS